MKLRRWTKNFGFCIYNQPK